MNELLITQTQYIRSVKPGPSQTKGTGSADGAFGKLVAGEVKRQSDKSKSKETDPEVLVCDIGQGMYVLPLFEQDGVCFIPEMEVSADVVPMDPGALAPLEDAAEQGQPIAGDSTEKAERPTATTPGEKNVFNSAIIGTADEKTPVSTTYAKPDEGPALTAYAGTQVPEAADVEAVFESVRVEQAVSEVKLPQETEPQPAHIKDFAIQSFENMKLPVKVGEHYDVREPDFAEKVSEKILYRTDGSAKQFEIELSPKELGKIKISVVFENGKAVVSLFCETARAQQILSSHAESIRSIVEQGSRHETGINIGRQNEERERNEDGGNKNQNDDNRQQQGRKPKREEMKFFIDQLKMDILLGAG